MTKIKNTLAYPYKENPVPNDFVTGSDSEDDGKTVSYKIQDIVNLLNSINGNEVVSYIFTESSVGELDENGSGYFLSEDNETDPSIITNLIVSKEIKTGIDLSDLFNFIKDNKESFLLKLRNVANPNNFIYFEITNVTEEAYQFKFEVRIYVTGFFSGILVDKSTYLFEFYLSAASNNNTIVRKEWVADGLSNTYDLETLSLASMVIMSAAPLRISDWSQTLNIITLTFVPNSGEIIQII